MEVFVVLIIVAAIVIGYVIAKTKEDQPTTESQTIAPRIAYSGKSYPFSEVADDPNFPHVRSIHTKIRGVTFENPDGANRQQIIRQWCHSGDALFLVREPNLPTHPNAIQVRRIVYSDVPDKPRLGEQLGYVSHDLAEELAPKMDHDGFVLFAWIMEVTGGEDDKNLGVNIQLEEYQPAQHPSRRGRKPH
jgi:HIRAN domain